jgi:transposase-like protein
MSSPNMMMAYRGIQLSYETNRRWCDTFAASYAVKLKRKRTKLDVGKFVVRENCTNRVDGQRSSQPSFSRIIGQAQN